jgi:hypothetical protein
MSDLLAATIAARLDLSNQTDAELSAYYVALGAESSRRYNAGEDDTAVEAEMDRVEALLMERGLI